MARKKKTTKKTGGLFSLFSKKKKSTRSRSAKQDSAPSSGLRIAAGIMVVTILVAGAAVGFIYMDRYVKTIRPADKAAGKLIFVKPGIWVNEQWQQKITNLIGDGPFPLNDTSAEAIAQKLQTLSWMDQVRVKTTPEQIEVEAHYRRPVGIVEIGRDKYYLDPQMTVMDYIPVTAVPVIEITGIASPRSIPTPGNRWAAEDAAAAVQILDYLYKCDLYYLSNDKIQKPLLDEIQSIDVTNFAARKSSSPDRPHIFLTVKDGSQVNWGAAIGQGPRYLEADAEKKCERLYQHFIDHNDTLQKTAKYIELRQL